MISFPRAYAGDRMRDRRKTGFTTAVGASLCAAFVADAQTIRIPDFRQPYAIATVRSGEACNDCGRIFSIREIALERRSAVPTGFQGVDRGGIVDRNLVGAVVYLPLSSASSDRPFVGGVGTPEMRERFGESTYEITARMDDGSARSVRRGDGTRYRVG